VDNLVEALEVFGMRIGSSVWGGFAPETSDIDFAVMDSTWKDVIQPGVVKGDFEGYNGLSIQLGGSGGKETVLFNIDNLKLYSTDASVPPINILTYSDKNYYKIHKVNESMKALVDTPVGEFIAARKGYRIRIFQALLTTVFEK
jgi:hypothetical protein